MSRRKIRGRLLIGFVLVFVLGLIATACGGAAPTPEVIKETVVVEIEKEVAKEVTKVVEKEVEVEKEVVVTATPEPIETPKVALIVSGQAQDQSWNQFMYDDAQALNEEGSIELSVAEDVTPADFERVATDYAEQDYDLVVGHTSDFVEPTIKVASAYPDVNFAITGATDFLPNLAGLNNWGHQTSALAGALAAMLTETNVVGIVGGFASPTQFVYHEGFKFGVHMVNSDRLEENPDAEQTRCLETFTGTWFDSAIGYEAGMAQMNEGADYIYISLSGPGFGVIQAAQETGKAKVIGSFTDMNQFAPEVVITSVERHAKLPLQAILNDIQNGTFTGKDYNFDHTNGGTSLSPFHNFEDDVPDEVKQRLADYEDQILSGKIRVPFVTAKLGGETGCTVQTESE